MKKALVIFILVILLSACSGGVAPTLSSVSPGHGLEPSETPFPMEKFGKLPDHFIMTSGKPITGSIENNLAVQIHHAINAAKLGNLLHSHKQSSTKEDNYAYA